MNNYFWTHCMVAIMRIDASKKRNNPVVNEKAAYDNCTYAPRWEFIKENKKVRKKERKCFFFSCPLRNRVFLFSYSLVFFYKFPPLKTWPISLIKHPRNVVKLRERGGGVKYHTPTPCPLILAHFLTFKLQQLQPCQWNT